MNIEKYLNRINYSGSLEPSLEVLKNLQRNHLLSVPFENLDIHNDIQIELLLDKIFEKVVNQNRGGFCYELNGLFYELLITLGFEAKRVSARVYDPSIGYGQEFDHFAIVVTINKTDYLTDVGFGEFTFEPLKLKTGLIQSDERGNYLIDKVENDYWRVSKMENNKPTPEYIFKNINRNLADYEQMCTYHQTSPKSNFTSKRLISIPTKNGRITISGNTLKIKEHNSILETEIKNDFEFNIYIKRHFYHQASTSNLL
jgi:N-hydroxyarylamine O-acetyltransferase